jgi:hypothetical protein
METSPRRPDLHRQRNSTQAIKCPAAQSRQSSIAEIRCVADNLTELLSRTAARWAVLARRRSKPQLAYFQPPIACNRAVPTLSQTAFGSDPFKTSIVRIGIPRSLPT